MGTFLYSTLQDGFELPTRLSVAAADCILVLTIALTKKALISEVSSSGKKSADSNAAADQLITPVRSAGGEKRVKSVGRYPQDSENMELEFLLWDHLDELIILVRRLQAVCYHLSLIFYISLASFGLFTFCAVTAILSKWNDQILIDCH